jgi:hypothetical protein
MIARLWANTQSACREARRFRMTLRMESFVNIMFGVFSYSITRLDHGKQNQEF